MKLENIGFYTLEDERAKNVWLNSPLWRCELILTSRCNFNCPYCRGIDEFNGDLPFKDAKEMVYKWIAGGLKNIRFSGGEPTLYPHLIDLVKIAKIGGIQNIAISTNGYSDLKIYRNLHDAGVNDFSISLDACCSSVGDTMSGGIHGAWQKVIDNIKSISEWTYVSVGIVMDDTNINELASISEFADSLGVSDIRILSSAQWNDKEKFKNLCTDEKILNKYPILKYRVGNFNRGRNVRGIHETDCHRCFLMLDDMAVMDNKHYPCIIHMREKGAAISTTKNKSINEIRKERFEFINSHNSFNDPICKNNCLDVCIDYNNRVQQFKMGLKETWKPVVGYENLYHVSDNGNVRTLRDSSKLKKFDIMKKCKHSVGYLRVNLCKDGKCKMKYIHVIELEAFRGPKPAGHDGNHKDLDKTNNFLWNLEYLSHAENIRHARRNKKNWKSNYNVNINSLNDTQKIFVNFICSHFKNNNGISPTYNEIGLHFGISKQGAYYRYRYLLKKIEIHGLVLKKTLKEMI